MKIKVIASEEDEYSTEQIIAVGSKYYRCVKNGGSRGSHSRNNRFPALLEDDKALTPEEATLAASAMGADEATLAAIE